MLKFKPNQKPGNVVKIAFFSLIRLWLTWMHLPRHSVPIWCAKCISCREMPEKCLCSSSPAHAQTSLSSLHQHSMLPPPPEAQYAVSLDSLPCLQYSLRCLWAKMPIPDTAIWAKTAKCVWQLKRLFFGGKSSGLVRVEICLRESEWGIVKKNNSHGYQTRITGRRQQVTQKIHRLLHTE